MKIFKYKDTSEYNIFDRDRIIDGVNIAGIGVIAFQILLMEKSFIMYNYVPIKYICLFLFMDIVYFIYRLYIIGYLNEAEGNNDLIMQDKDEKNDPIDWSGFDMNDYPKVNYYSLFNNLKPECFHGKYRKTVSNDAEVVLLSICLFLMGVMAKYSYYFIPQICFLCSIVMLVSIPWVHIHGKKLYIKLCKEMYRDDYLKKVSIDRRYKTQQDIIRKYSLNQKVEHIICKAELKDFNDASKWYIEQGVPLGDILLLTKDGGILTCLEQTKNARECGLPDDYYIIAVKDTHWLCCNAREECIYAFSKAIGLTHTKYQSLYEYIIDYCHIPFDVENDA